LLGITDAYTFAVQFRISLNKNFVKSKSKKGQVSQKTGGGLPTQESKKTKL